MIKSKAQALTGSILEGNALVAEFTANADAYSKSNPVPATILTAANKGAYTAVFPAAPAPNGDLNADQFPQGDGWTTLQIKPKGTLKMRGRFADGSKFSYSSALDAANQFPIYAPLYHGGGAVAGSALFAASDPAPQLVSSGMRWFRPPQNSPLYPAGWIHGIALGFDGASRNVATEPNALPIGTATLQLTGGNLPAVLTNTLSIGAKNKIRTAGSGIDKLKVKLKPSGALSGNFVHPGSRKKTKFDGVTLRDPTEARGFFLGPTQSGLILIEP